MQMTRHHIFFTLHARQSANAFAATQQLSPTAPAPKDIREPKKSRRGGDGELADAKSSRWISNSGGGWACCTAPSCIEDGQWLPNRLSVCATSMAMMSDTITQTAICPYRYDP
ncbi:Uncharacterized protein APZ42_030702 [Daphnia magna]|uniref:Uncharacterized protein n=1 Tax=Daphnia magna TaxID=35525 RepID=A0A164NGZ2_9CRUS|nr:Uncharacterized protein APZ42_030702 [Daphnia magna]